MHPNEKPVDTTTPEPTPAGAEGAQGAAAPSADHQSNFLESLSDEGKSYLKGLGIESFDGEALAKIVDSSIKQKSSVSDKSRELEELKARLASQGKPVDTTPEPAADPNPAPNTPSEDPAQPVAPSGPSTPAQGAGVTQNDLFDLSIMINSQFPELVEEAADGRLFAELRQFGYFGVEGINKKEVFDHLTRKHSAAKELKELREIKAKYEAANEEENPTYNPYGTPAGSGTKDATWARQVVIASVNGGQVEAKDLNEARDILQKAI